MNGKILLLLCILFFIYLLIGAAIFQALEKPSEEKQCEEIQREVNEFAMRIENSSISKEDIGNLTRVIQFAASYGITVNENLTVSCVVNWDLEGSFFFCGTVLTTIGYGHIAPVTYIGQTVCILYAIIGIPLFGIMFTGIGAKIAERIERLEARLKGKTKRGWVRKILIALIILVAFTLLCMLIPAGIFYYVEGWTYHEAFYYTFISLTTIGFGDYVAGVNPEITYIRVYRAMVYFWILFGLAFAATVITLLTELWMQAGPEARKSRRMKKVSPTGDMTKDYWNDGAIHENQLTEVGGTKNLPHSEYDF